MTSIWHMTKLTYSWHLITHFYVLQIVIERTNGLGLFRKRRWLLAHVNLLITVTVIVNILYLVKVLYVIYFIDNYWWLFKLRFGIFTKINSGFTVL